MISSPAVQRRVTVGAFAGFILIGALQALFGPAVPAIEARFSVAAATAGLSFSALFAGTVSGVLISGALARIPARLRLAAGCALVALGGAGSALAPAWPALLVAAYVAGLGFGALDLGLNLLFANGYGERSAAMLNLLNAAFGVGAVLGPLAVSLAGGDYRVPLLACAAGGLALGPVVLSARDRPPPARSARGSRRRGDRWLVAAFVGFFFLYVSVETGVGTWEVTDLHGRLGWPVVEAARVAALFWAALTAGRLLAAPLSLRLAPDRLVLGALGLAALALGLALLPALAPAAYALTGLALAPVFPTALVWFNRVRPGSGAGTSLILAGASLGAVVFPPLVGAANDALGGRGVPVALLALAAIALVTGLALRRAVPA